MSHPYSDLLIKFKQDPDNEDIKLLLKLRNLFICSAGMQYNPDSPEIIKLLTGISIKNKDIKDLSNKLLKKFKEEDKRIHGIMYKSPNITKFLGVLKDDS